MKLMRIGVDLAKNVFQIHGVDCHEKPVWRQRLPRERWLQAVLEKIEPGCEIGMESCGGAHHWARQLEARGFLVKLIAPQFVKPYVKSNKNDANDAEAICEAMSRPSMRFVTIKTVEQQDIQATHRIRSGLIEQRTAKANQIRGLVSEYGLVAPKELLSLRRAIPCWLEDAENGLTLRFRHLLDGLWGDSVLNGQVLAIPLSGVWGPRSGRLQRLATRRAWARPASNCWVRPSTTPTACSSSGSSSMPMRRSSPMSAAPSPPAALGMAIWRAGSPPTGRRAEPRRMRVARRG